MISTLQKTTASDRNIWKDMKISCSEENIIRACETNEFSLDKIEEIGSACKITVSPSILNFWPFTRLNRKERICKRLVEVDSTNVLRQTLDQRVLTRLAAISNRPLVKSTNYDSYIENGIFALLFLIKRNQRECVVLANFKEIIERILRLKDMTLERLAWSDISIYWSDGKMSVPGDLQSFIAKSRKCIAGRATRFLLSLVTIVSITNMHHANILIYDKVTGILERFDPYQTQLNEFRTEELDRMLHALFKKVDRDNYRRFIKPVQLPDNTRMGLQQKAEAENEENPSDPIGFCQPWTVMYADARLSLPNQDPASIPEMLEIMAHDKNLSLTQFIRNYADSLQSISNRICIDFLIHHPEYKHYKDQRIPMYALFLQELLEYSAIFT